ncbi:hypothetical protein MHI24_23460 [Paenibacillus sp. FSL K6-1096]|uniref:hypothetical protein n=1 Tax=Paenibacillus sp. FSL K6-1096 TaxID=2921460 RepID=UPI0030EEC744
MYRKSFTALFTVILTVAALAAIVVVIISKSSAVPPSPANSNTLPSALDLVDQDGNPVHLELSSLPLYEQYLESSRDIPAEIARTQAETLPLSRPERFLLLKYNCGNKHCDTNLVRMAEPESGSPTISIGLAGGIYQDFQLSPDGNSVLLRFAYNEGGTLLRHILIAAELRKMELLPAASATLADTYMHTPNWPIVSYRWISNQQFRVERPDLDSAEYQAVQQWSSLDHPPVRAIDILLKTGTR